MIKFTSKDLMNAMGLKVGDKFIVRHNDAFDGVWEVVHEKVYHDKIICKSDKCAYQLIDFTEEELELLPKYTLTDDDKAYLRITTHKEIGRDWAGELVYPSESRSLRFSLGIKNDMFQFIKEKEFILVDELRKCL